MIRAAAVAPLSRYYRGRWEEPVIDRLLTIKLATPRPSRPPVTRPRLVDLLSGALTVRLALLSAPPGFGKTMALLDWLSAAGVPSSWISLDEADNDPVRFLRYLSAGIGKLTQQVAPPFGEIPPDADPLDVVEVLAGLLAERTEPAVLVLDDYHTITAPAVQRLVGSLLDRLPMQAHLVIATRADPALALARLRARGELLEVRAEALRFSVDEARDFFGQRMGLSLAERDLEAIVTRTEGWPAVLQLAGISLGGRPDVSGLVRDFTATHRYLLDYVVEEVLAGLPEETQGFLLRTSILDRLCGPLCDAVTGEPAGQERLEAFERDNLLIVPLDDERRWYRYHALFAEILRARLAAFHPEEIGALHARASAWYEEQGDDEGAITHAIHSGDVERMSRVVAEACGRHLNAGELSTVKRWLDALPPEAVRDHAQLSAAYAWWLLLIHRSDGVAERLDDAERALAAGNDGGPLLRPSIAPQLALLRSQLAGLVGDVPTAIEQARLARELVPAGLPPVEEGTLRGTASDMLALALLRAGDLDGAAQAYEEALPDLRRGHNVFALGRTVYDLTKIAIRRGDPAGALFLCESQMAWTEAEMPGGTGAIWAAMASVRAELGEVALAEVAARRAIELATHSGDVPIMRAAEAILEHLAPRPAAEPGASASGHRIQAARGGLVESLSQRELEVLRLVALGRSNSQIATELFVTVGTVKSHLHTISGKLGAANRVEAVARGRELGLLD